MAIISIRIFPCVWVYVTLFPFFRPVDMQHALSVPIFPPRMVLFLVMILESDFEYIFNASDQLLRVRSAARFKASRQGNRLLFAEIFS